MPLGASITDGFNIPGGYRITLWQRAQEIGRTMDFVGSRYNGPDELGDKNHEGHPGWKIDQIDASVNDWMETGLTNSNGISFNSYNYPGKYIRHSNWLLYRDLADTDTVKADATFCPR